MYFVVIRHTLTYLGVHWRNGVYFSILMNTLGVLRGTWAYLG